MKLTVVIPALNEEAAIGSIIERTLAAKEVVRAGSPVTEVEVIVVSDGSTDKTAEIAATYDGVRVIKFETNRGYGAAIKKGFEVGTGEIVGFLDADGTCDPRFFADLCDALIGEGADVAIGSRMGPESRMPGVRRIGNRVYALILSILSNRAVTDTASGMRVVRRSTLPHLYPLPDGLHFTPAMSARVLMDDQLTLVERPMPYEERIGESKLHVLRDGVRFLRTIVEMSMMWQPARFFVAGSVIFLALMATLGFFPIEMWIREGRLREDMIYRLMFCSLLGALGVTMFSAGALCDLVSRLWDVRPGPRTFASAALDRVYTLPTFALVTALAAPLAIWLVGRGIWTRLTAGYVDLHWSRLVLAGLIVFSLGQMLVTVLIANLVRFHVGRRHHRVSTSAVRLLAESVSAQLEIEARNESHNPDPTTAEVRQ